MTQLLLGIDLGTGSSKGVLTTPDGEIVATATLPRARSMQMPRPGWAEVDAETVWWADVVALCRDLTGRAAGRPIGAFGSLPVPDTSTARCLVA